MTEEVQNSTAEEQQSTCFLLRWVHNYWVRKNYDGNAGVLCPECREQSCMRRMLGGRFLTSLNSSKMTMLGLMASCSNHGWHSPECTSVLTVQHLANVDGRAPKWYLDAACRLQSIDSSVPAFFAFVRKLLDGIAYARVYIFPCLHNDL